RTYCIGFSSPKQLLQSLFNMKNSDMMIHSVEELEDLLSTPSAVLIQEMTQLEGDILILGVGGKMGPSLAKLAVRAVKEAGVDKKVIGVSRFSESGLREELESFGVETISIDLLNDTELQSLPD